MAYINWYQDAANKSERKYTAAHLVAKPYPHVLTAGIHRYGSFININTSGIK